MRWLSLLVFLVFAGCATGSIKLHNSHHSIPRSLSSEPPKFIAGPQVDDINFNNVESLKHSLLFRFDKPLSIYIKPESYKGEVCADEVKFFNFVKPLFYDWYKSLDKVIARNPLWKGRVQANHDIQLAQGEKEADILFVVECQPSTMTIYVGEQLKVRISSSSLDPSNDLLGNPLQAKDILQYRAKDGKIFNFLGPYIRHEIGHLFALSDMSTATNPNPSIMSYSERGQLFSYEITDNDDLGLEWLLREYLFSQH